MGINISLPHSGDFQVAVDTIDQVCDKVLPQAVLVAAAYYPPGISTVETAASTSAVCLVTFVGDSLTLHVPQPCHTCDWSMDKRTGH
jgi:hypothetical protein